jgi:hypothetical protein
MLVVVRKQGARPHPAESRSETHPNWGRREFCVFVKAAVTGGLQGAPRCRPSERWLGRRPGVSSSGKPGTTRGTPSSSGPWPVCTNTSHLLETTVRGRYALNAEADRTSDRTPRCRPFRERDRLHGDCHSQTEQQRDGGELRAMLVLIAGTWSRLLPYRSKLASRSLRSAAEPWFWGKGRSVGGSAHASTVRWWCPSTASTSGVDRRPGRYWPTAIPAPIRRRPA